MVSKKQILAESANSKKIHKPTKVEKVKKTKPLKELTKKPLVLLENVTSPELLKSSNEVKSKKKRKYVMPSKSITEELVNSSLNALQQLTIHYQKKNTILEDEVPIFAEINCIKIQNNRGNIKFVLPHSTVSSTGEVCLITPDLKKGKKVDHEPTVEYWKEILSKAGAPVKTVLPMRQLRVEYDQFELKRRLLTQHDFIMVDTRVLSHVSHLLGKMFFKKHNMLIPVRLNEKTDHIKKDINAGLHTAILRLSVGATSTLIVGHTAMPQKLVKENILSVVQQLREKYPGGEANIRTLSLKLPLSLSLPLYVTLRPTSSVDAPKLKRKRPKHFSVVEDELSTIPGSRVRVAPDGTIHLKKSVEAESDMEEGSGDEEDAEDSKVEEE